MEVESAVNTEHKYFHLFCFRRENFNIVQWGEREQNFMTKNLFKWSTQTMFDFPAKITYVDILFA